MVFGTLPIISGTTIGEHYSFLKGGHDSVINDWRTDFGRHLTLVDDSEAKPQKDHHSDYIFEASAWDDDEDWDDDKDIEIMKRAQGMIFQRMRGRTTDLKAFELDEEKPGREVRVQRELQRRAESGRGTGSMAGLDWDADAT
eukprot:scaffold1335_cov282-Chaetoceros_neogracile.AAC.2